MGARYSSVNTHLKIRQSRRDDLEALGYVLLLLIRDLPWRQKKGEKPEIKWRRILEEKKKYTPEALCEGLPSADARAFTEFFKHCRSLKYFDTPDYDYLVSLF